MPEEFATDSQIANARDHHRFSYHLLAFTDHGTIRVRSRSISRRLVELVILYGKEIGTYDGNITFFMDRESLRQVLKKIASKEIAIWLRSKFKTRKGIVVAISPGTHGRIVTAYFTANNEKIEVNCMLRDPGGRFCPLPNETK